MFIFLMRDGDADAITPQLPPDVATAIGLVADHTTRAVFGTASATAFDRTTRHERFKSNGFVALAGCQDESHQLFVARRTQMNFGAEPPLAATQGFGFSSFGRTGRVLMGGPSRVVDRIFALKELDADSIPVNFLMPFDGTPFEETWELTPATCLRILAMARFVCPDKEVRIAGGREMHLRSLQGLALHVANSIFLGDYLTSEGQEAQDDLALIRDNGFVVLGSEEHLAQSAETSQDPAIRRRGAGTTVSPNA
jgi:hypothetical protein